VAREKAEQERLARERAEAARVAAEKAEAARAEQERARQARLVMEKAAAERVAREKAERERQARERAEAARVAAEKAEQERADADRPASGYVTEGVPGILTSNQPAGGEWDTRQTRRLVATAAILLTSALAAIWFHARRPIQVPVDAQKIASLPPAVELSVGQSKVQERPTPEPAALEPPTQRAEESTGQEHSPGSAPPTVKAPDSQVTGPKRIHVGGQVMQAKVVYQPAPPYPQLAKMAHIQGTVRLGATVARDGTIKSLKVISGQPMLIKAVLDTVEHWRYQPTLMNGQAVEVETEVDVNFTLNEGDTGTSESDRGDSGGRQVVGPGSNESVTPPAPIYQPAAPYTEQARMSKIQGTVRLLVSIDAQGNVSGTSVANALESSLDKSAADTVRTWKFKPATRHGIPVPATVAVNVEFKLY